MTPKFQWLTGKKVSPMLLVNWGWCLSAACQQLCHGLWLCPGEGGLKLCSVFFFCIPRSQLSFQTLFFKVGKLSSSWNVMEGRNEGNRWKDSHLPQSLCHHFSNHTYTCIPRFILIFRLPVFLRTPPPLSFICLGSSGPRTLPLCFSVFRFLVCLFLFLLDPRTCFSPVLVVFWKSCSVPKPR